MASGAARQTNGFGVSLCLATERLMAACRSATERTTPCLSRRQVSAAKKPSTVFSQDDDVGVKWKVRRGCRSSQARTLACLWGRRRCRGRRGSPCPPAPPRSRSGRGRTPDGGGRACCGRSRCLRGRQARQTASWWRGACRRCWSLLERVMEIPLRMPASCMHASTPESSIGPLRLGQATGIARYASQICGTM